MYAAMENKIPLIEKMLDLGCDVHAKNREHYTTLHLASMYSREDTIRLLLAKRADPTAQGGVSSKMSNPDQFYFLQLLPASLCLRILKNTINIFCGEWQKLPMILIKFLHSSFP